MGPAYSQQILNWVNFGSIVSWDYAPSLHGSATA